MVLWARILQKVPSSQLVLRIDGSTPVLRQELVNEGIDLARVRWLKRFSSEQAYLQGFNAIDIALDPFPYNGQTTSCDAFWMGVPLVTLAGDRDCARVGVNLLTNLDLNDLIAHTHEEYVAIASRLAGARARLHELRSNLRDRLRMSPLMNAKTFSVNVEAAYRSMWRDWCSTPK